MNALAPIPEAATLKALVLSAATKLAAAESSAEVLDARRDATATYDAAKIAGRMAKAKEAHDAVISAVYRAQADALEIESLAKRRLADEYDAAQARGEIKAANNLKTTSNAEAVSAADVGLTHKEIHEARAVRDAEAADPGVTRRALDEIIERGEEPTRAALKREVAAAPPKPVVDDDSLWLWGRLRDFERKGLLAADPARLLIGMTREMRGDIQRLAPLVRNLMEELEMRFVPA